MWSGGHKRTCDDGEAASSKKPRDVDLPDADGADDDNSDDYDDLDEDEEVVLGDSVNDDDLMDEAEDDQSTVSVSTSISTCSSVGSNTPSLIGENLESFSLCENESSLRAAVGVVGSMVGATSGQHQLFLSQPVVKSCIQPLRRSLFSHVPPSLNFVHHNEVPEITLPAELRKQLRWRLSNITPAIVKKVVTNSGFRLMKKNCSEWCGTWGKHMKASLFKDIHQGQKINHLPGTFNLGRKDRLWKNYHKQRLKFGKQEFSYLPRTFCLPADSRILRKVWDKQGRQQGDAKWIVKPPAMARGTGIAVINKWHQIPKTRPLIVQKYVARPHLINNIKYDLRIYVLVTCSNPLVIYLYDEGLVRFASKSYSTDAQSLSDVFTHLTNYSINKHSSTYLPNEDPDARTGHKWTLSSLWQYMAEKGIDHKTIIDKIKDLVIKTLISAEDAMHAVYKANINSHYVGYELFGFDILLDSKLKPWLIEVNISPSLHSASQLDLDVKSPLATEVFNLARYHIPPVKIPQKVHRDILEKLNMAETVSNVFLDRRLYARELSKAERAKQDTFEKLSDRRDEYLLAILEHLTPDDVRFLIRLEDEFSQANRFSRIFPTPDTHRYFRFFDKPRYYNLLLDAWESKYADQRGAAVDRLEQLCQQKVHLKVPAAAASLYKKKFDMSVLKAPTSNDQVAVQSPPITDLAPPTSSSPQSVATATSSSESSADDRTEGQVLLLTSASGDHKESSDSNLCSNSSSNSQPMKAVLPRHCTSSSLLASCHDDVSRSYQDNAEQLCINSNS